MAGIIQDLNDRMESLELMTNPEFIEGHKRAKEQIKIRDFGDWDDL